MDSRVTAMRAPPSVESPINAFDGWLQRHLPAPLRRLGVLIFASIILAFGLDVAFVAGGELAELSQEAPRLGEPSTRVEADIRSVYVAGETVRAVVSHPWRGHTIVNEIKAESHGQACPGERIELLVTADGSVVPQFMWIVEELSLRILSLVVSLSAIGYGVRLMCGGAARSPPKKLPRGLKRVILLTLVVATVTLVFAQAPGLFVGSKERRPTTGKVHSIRAVSKQRTKAIVEYSEGKSRQVIEVPIDKRDCDVGSTVTFNLDEKGKLYRRKTTIGDVAASSLVILFFAAWYWLACLPDRKPNTLSWLWS